MAVRELRRTKTHSVGRWIKLDTHEEIGTVRALRSTDKHVNKKYIAVEVWEQQGRKWVVSRLAWWRKSKVVEVKVKRTNTTVQWANIGKTHIAEEENNEPEVEQHRTTNVGLYTVYAEDTTKSDIRIRGEDPTQTIYVASDGSV
jgi:hypothetical protein